MIPTTYQALPCVLKHGELQGSAQSCTFVLVTQDHRIPGNAASLGCIIYLGFLRDGLTYVALTDLELTIRPGWS